MIDGLTPAIRDITYERMTHEQRGWTADHDAEHGAGHLTGLSSRYVSAFSADRVNHRSTYDRDRTNLVKAASLLVAAIELLDRTQGATS